MKVTEASRKLSDCRDMKMVFSFPVSKMKASNHRNSWHEFIYVLENSLKWLYRE